MKYPLFSILFLAIGTQALELTSETWEKQTSGKTVFIKFFAPWCGHCKKMKPAWDVLMKEYDGHKNILIADVDCIGTGKDICAKVGVKGFPTVKHGNPESLVDYTGGRDVASLKKFAKTLKPICSWITKENCSEEELLKWEEVLKKGRKEIEQYIAEIESDMEDLEVDFKADVSRLQKQYETLMVQKEEKMKELKSKDLSTYKMVLQHLKGQKKDEL